METRTIVFHNTELSTAKLQELSAAGFALDPSYIAFTGPAPVEADAAPDAAPQEPPTPLTRRKRAR